MVNQEPPPQDQINVLVRKLLISVLAIALLLVAYFGFNAVASFVYWNDKRHQNQPIASWMTPRYVAKSWSVPHEVIATALGQSRRDGSGQQSLDQLAKARGVTAEALIAELEAAIAAHDVSHKASK